MITQVRPVQPCHRCGGELYLTATMPHPDLSGSRLLPLCPRCDATDPAAHGLLAFFAVHSVVDTETRPQLHRLAAEWLAAKQREPTGVTETDLNSEAEAWRAGEFS